MTAVLRVAVVGTGRMGAAMAGRVAATGHHLTVWDRTRSTAEAAVAGTGGTVAGTAREAAAAADVVIVSLADDAACEAAYTGTDGLVAGLRPGTVVADTSTVAPETVRRLAPAVVGAGSALVDAPVSGSVPSVTGGTLLVMAGGEADAVDRARPALDAFAERVILLGPLGSGATMKLAVNAMVFALTRRSPRRSCSPRRPGSRARWPTR